jgi:hypothetical protein
MVAIAATSYATPSAQAWQGRARLDQARREADQAEANARQLRTEADQAEQEAQQGQSKVRDASAAVAQSDSTYSAQLQKQVAASENRQVRALLSPPATPASQAPAFPDNTPKLSQTPWSKVNQRVSSGRFVNQSV